MHPKMMERFVKNAIENNPEAAEYFTKLAQNKTPEGFCEAVANEVFARRIDPEFGEAITLLVVSLIEHTLGYTEGQFFKTDATIKEFLDKGDKVRALTMHFVACIDFYAGFFDYADDDAIVYQLFLDYLIKVFAITPEMIANMKNQIINSHATFKHTLI